MSKYVCSICGYIYDESTGDEKTNIAPGTLWQHIPSEWKCPLCNAEKSLFSQVTDHVAVSNNNDNSNSINLPKEITYSSGELAAIFSNLAKGWEKQYAPEIGELCLELASYYQKVAKPEPSAEQNTLKDLLNDDLGSLYPNLNDIASNEADRGALRALRWSEQVTRMNQAHVTNFIEKKSDYIKDTNVYVCDICGFMYIGDEKPDICPVCKVPSMKMTRIERGA